MSLSSLFLVVGAGPSGCYVVDQLKKQFPDCRIDVIDKLPQPFGLIRTGVAPDHEKIKQLYQYFERILSQDGVCFFGNIHLGKELGLEDLSPFYHAVFVCTGTIYDTFLPALPAPTEFYCGSREVVHWYNGYSHLNTHFDPASVGSKLTLIGMGNVALDIARLFLKDPALLSATEIPGSCLELLKQRPVNEVHIFARRGPAQAKCTPLELGELLDLDDVAIHIDAEQLHLSATDELELETNANARKNSDHFKKHITKTSGKRQLHLHFYSKINKISHQDGAVNITFERTALSGEAFHQQASGTGDYFSHSCQYIMSCIGYRGQAINPLEFDEKKAIVPNINGKVETEIHPHIYVSGWIKRGPNGVIGTNKRDALETVATYVNTLNETHYTPKEKFYLSPYLTEKSLEFFTLSDWKTCDFHERDMGDKSRKTRVKLTTVDAIKDIV